jgi:hypothetical protein
MLAFSQAKTARYGLAQTHVRYWPKADISHRTAYVRFQIKTDIAIISKASLEQVDLLAEDVSLAMAMAVHESRLRH